MSVKTIAVLSLMVPFVAACGEVTPPQAKTEGVASAAASAADAKKEEMPEAKILNGAGATFPYPIYSQWAHTYHKVTGAKLNYQSIGSGGGIAQIKAKTVDFGASDAPMKPKDLDEAGLIQFPMIMGGVVPVVNVEGVTPGALKIPQDVLANIFLGKIRKWNDPAIVAANPELNLPAVDVSVIHRADGSGTTWIFTNYLAKISSEWKDKVGSGKAVSWPTGMGGKGNEGVAAYVQRVKGAIGYVEFAYALQNKMSHASLQNKNGKYVQPTVESFQAAAANADWAGTPEFYVVLTDQPGENTWPITGASFILMYKDPVNPANSKAALKFFDWAYTNGAEQAKTLHYVPIPKEVVVLVHKQWTESIKAGGQSIWM